MSMPPRSTKTKSAPADVWIDLDDVADLIGVSTRTVRRYVATGELPAYRIGPRIIRVKRSDVDALMRPVPVAPPVA